jgi:feruloyl esterase
LEQVAKQMGGMAQVQQFLRLYLVPGKAHSSQGRSFTVNGNSNSVPLPKLPGGANQTPSPEQDQMFTALSTWVEKGLAPEDIVIESRDSTVSYPLCVYPKKITWNQTGSVKAASSYACR